MDKIIFTGNLGADPEQKTSKAGKDYCNLRVAVTHYDNNGEKKTEWRQCVVFGKTADFCMKYLRKGASVTIEGYPTPRAYTPKNGGDPIGVIDVRVETIDAGRGAGGGADNSASDNGMTDVSGQETLPF